MARNREKPGSMAYQVKQVLDSKLAIGESKHHDKMKNITGNKIYSWDTYRSYLKHASYFGNWAKETYGCRTLDQARPYVNDWLKTRQNLSAYTQKLEACSLAKVYGCTTKEFIKTTERKREDITRSRGTKVRDNHFSEKNNQDFVDFCKSTGLRRNELKSLRGSALKKHNDKYYISVSSGAKGGKTRIVPVINNVDKVVEKMQQSGANKVFDKVPNGADVHGYRGDYASNYYKSIARDLKTLPVEERYCCRGDLKGTWYDKKAMLEVSKALGHNRISVIAGHYLKA